jgi:hypothetical protein
MPEPGPVGVSVDPLGEALGPSVLPDGLWVEVGPVAGPVVVDPAVLPVVVPFVDEPVVLPVAAGAPAEELPLAEPMPLCATANEAVSANAAANAVVANFIVVSLVLLTKDDSPSTPSVPLVFSAMEPARLFAWASLRRGNCLPSAVTRVGTCA